MMCEGTLGSFKQGWHRDRGQHQHHLLWRLLHCWTQWGDQAAGAKSHLQHVVRIGRPAPRLAAALSLERATLLRGALFADWEED